MINRVNDLALVLEAAATGAVTTAVRAENSIRWRWPLVAAVALVALIAVFMVVRPAMIFDRGSGTATEQTIRSIAVLPLDNLSGDPTQDFFADGMTDALTADLAKIGALTVISRTSVMRYKGTTTPLPKIAKELGVEAVVEGSVVRSGDRVRVTAQLIEAATDRHLWAENYERDMTDILVLQGEVARAIADEIRVVLTPAEEELLSAAAPVDPKSYEATLMGQYRLKEESFEGARAAVKHFEEAIVHDPGNPLAHSGLAEAYLGWGAFMDLDGDSASLAEEAARKALAIDDTLAEAHIARGMVAYYNWDWDTARGEYERAVELNPSLSEAHHALAHYHWNLGDLERGLAESQRYLQLDPQWPRPKECMAFHLSMTGSPTLALRYAERAVEIDPTYYAGQIAVGDAMVHLGRLEEAAAAYRASEGLSEDPFAIAELSQAYVAALSGDRTEALEMVYRIESERSEYSRFLVASVLAVVGETDEAFARLESMMERKEWFATVLKIHPWIDPLRDDPRFDDLMERLNFPES